MHQPDPLLLLVKLSPVGPPGENRWYVTDTAGGDQGRCGGAHPWNSVEHRRRRPGADRDVRQRRVQRMAEPDAVQGVTDRLLVKDSAHHLAYRGDHWVKVAGVLQAI